MFFAIRFSSALGGRRDFTAAADSLQAQLTSCYLSTARRWGVSGRICRHDIRSFEERSRERLALLFAHIGWAHYYDGTEPIHGNFSYLKDDPKHEMKNWEAEAFLKNDGVFSCGIGAGKVSSQRLPSASRSARNALLVPMCGPSLRL
jgi:hypothetical protein